jgi:hypothetical protein
VAECTANGLGTVTDVTRGEEFQLCVLQHRGWD